jgi:hypothetical protein
MLFAVGRDPLLQARDLGVVTFDQGAQLDLAHGGAARELGVATGEVDAVATHEQPDAGRTDRDSRDKEDKTHRHHRLPIRERSTVSPSPDAMHAVRHGFIPWVARACGRLTARLSWHTITTGCGCGFRLSARRSMRSRSPR